MTALSPRGAPTVPALRWIALLGGTGCCIFALWPLISDDAGLGILSVTVTVALLAIGLLLGSEPGQRSNARLFSLAGILWAVSWLNEWNVGPWPLVGACGSVWVAVAACVFLRFPDARLTNRADRAYVSVLSVWIVAGALAGTLLSLPAWHDYAPNVVWPHLAASRQLFNRVNDAADIGGVALALVYPVLLQRRYRRLRALDRNLAAPVLVGAVALCLGIGVVVANGLFSLTNGDGAYYIEVVCLLTTPVAFLSAVVRRRLAFAELARLPATLAGISTTAQVRAALRDTLDDPLLEIYYWVPDMTHYVDTNGNPATIEPVGRFTVPVQQADGQPLASISVDLRLERHEALVRAAVATCGLALENARLHAELIAHAEQLRSSRSRILQAGIAERQRIERDLHDGAQQRLIALTLRLALSQATAPDEATREALAYARKEVHHSLDELRNLARGIHPAVLSQSGLAPAVEAITESLIIPVELDIPDRRLDPAVESTAYFVICEALTNCVKHSRATHAWVNVTFDADELRVRVSDNGSGGADAEAGSGLTGLLDRVSALAGWLTVISPAGGGTTITAGLPCG